VADAPLSAQGVPVVVSSFGPVVNQVVATFTDADPNAKAGDFTAMINWGDGSLVPGIVQAAPGGGFQVLGSHQYAAPGRFLPQVLITDVNTAGDVAPATATATSQAIVGSLNERFVAQVFRDLLGRLVTPTELSIYVPQLDRGVSRSAVVRQIEHLPEFWQVEVRQAYQTVFGVGPTTQELANGVKALSHGEKAGELRVHLYASATFFDTRGGGTNAGFVSTFVQDVLHHPPDPVTLARLTGELNHGVSRTDVMLAVLRGTEARVTKVVTLTEHFVHQPPPSSELTSRINLSEEELIAAILSSPEYLALL
jgi:hypothetical protein